MIAQDAKQSDGNIFNRFCYYSTKNVLLTDGKVVLITVTNAPVLALILADLFKANQLRRSGNKILIFRGPGTENISFS